MKNNLLDPVREEMVVLSTAHLTKRDSELLAEENPDLALRVIPHEYGWICTAYSSAASMPDPRDYQKHLESFGFSESFFSILNYLRAFEVPWVNFDADGTELKIFKSYDW